MTFSLFSFFFCNLFWQWCTNFHSYHSLLPFFIFFSIDKMYHNSNIHLHNDTFYFVFNTSLTFTWTTHFYYFSSSSAWLRSSSRKPEKKFVRFDWLVPPGRRGDVIAGWVETARYITTRQSEASRRENRGKLRHIPDLHYVLVSVASVFFFIHVLSLSSISWGMLLSSLIVFLLCFIVRVLFCVIL